jgi:hypothetical protein
MPEEYEIGSVPQTLYVQEQPNSSLQVEAFVIFLFKLTTGPLFLAEEEI